jgi:hypothetical protein
MVWEGFRPTGSITSPFLVDIVDVRQNEQVVLTQSEIAKG